ncbi:hypothetical protein PAAG_11665 [Paracoccidioides lutzii Pb01]|uniref:Uncharacterized protein n=1 Tax=Paracoccidioides lutzii (strain ATCC MYA-826 / Pb01) TaxID=502779 RepID=A0A0A2V5U0_PARBA|nr:hypothetical protein PAAG_11665 [Paracoccidioides lutzii Pb01]KGQ01672.1 hypothetical protein PAAG_11665 [Paracoccidioides lutzii Pb01]
MSWTMDSNAGLIRSRRGLLEMLAPRARGGAANNWRSALLSIQAEHRISEVWSRQLWMEHYEHATSDFFGNGDDGSSHSRLHDRVHELNSPGKGSTVKRFEKWNYMSTEELAAAKQEVISGEEDFLRIVEVYFTPYYQFLIPCVNRLRRLVFSDDIWIDFLEEDHTTRTVSLQEGLIVGMPQDSKRLYDPIIKAYDDTIALIETEQD